MATKWINGKGKEQFIEVQAICPYINGEHRGIVIEWDGTNGWGKYTVSIVNDKIIGESECMDDNSDKRFLRALFEDILAQINIID